MRKTITGTGGMLLIQTLKDAGVEYLFTNPGSAETGHLRRARRGRRPAARGRQARGAGGGDGRRLSPHQRQGRRRHRARRWAAPTSWPASSSTRRSPARRSWSSPATGRPELQDYRGLAPFPGLTQAESMRPITKEARCAYHGARESGRDHRRHHPGAARGDHAADGARVPLHQRGAAQPRGARGADRRGGAATQIERPGAGARRRRSRRSPARLGEAQCPVLHLRRRRLARGRAGRGRAAGRGARSAGVHARRQIFANFPHAPSALSAACIPSPRTSRRSRASSPISSSSSAARACTAPSAEPRGDADRPEPAAHGPSLPARRRRAVRAARDAPRSRRGADAPAARRPERRVGPPAREGARVRQAS